MPVIQIAQRALDLDRAAAFYTELLGVPPAARYDPPGLLFFRLDGLRLLLEAGAPSSLVYFGVDELDATVERLRARGVPIVSEPAPVFHHDDEVLGPAGTDERMAFVSDSEGNTVGLVEQR